MAERDPLPPPPPPPPLSPIDHADTWISEQTLTQLPNFSNGTYVIQVPKDQIYRVPPPENARIAEFHRNPPEKGSKRTRLWCLIISVLVIVMIIGGVLGGLYHTINEGKDPSFSIRHFVLNTSPYPQYNITIQAHNSNSKVGILYKKGGEVSLSLKKKHIASAAYPNFNQDPDNSRELVIKLEDSQGELPPEVEKSVRDKKKKVNVTFSLTIHHLPTQMKLGELYSGTKNYDVTCQLTVDTLSKATRILSQQCQTKPL